MLMGPGGMIFKGLSKLGKKAAKTTGHKMNAIVKKDMAASDKILKDNYFLKYKDDFATYHDKKLHDLVTNDSGVSPSWIKELIEDSNTTEQLGKVLIYLKDGSKTMNLTTGMKRSMISSSMAKIQAIQDKEMFLKVVAFIRDHGGDLL